MAGTHMPTRLPGSPRQIVRPPKRREQHLPRKLLGVVYAPPTFSSSPQLLWPPVSREAWSAPIRHVRDRRLLTLAPVAGGLVLAILYTRLGHRLPLPAPGVFLLAAAAVTALWPDAANGLSIRSVERIAVVAGRSPPQRRHGHRLAPHAALGWAGALARRLGNVRHRRAPSHRRPRDPRLLMAARRRHRRRAGSDGSGGRVLGARRHRDQVARLHDPWRERRASTTQPESR
jgi:hypothetical protein